MSTQVQAQVSKRDTVVLGGNMALRRGLGGGSVTMVLRRQLSPISSVELLAIVGLRSILSLQTSRYLFPLLEVQVVVACGAKAVDRLL
jgi:DnaJ family protein C protein 11